MSISHRDLDLGFFQRLLLQRIRFFGMNKQFGKIKDRHRFLLVYALVEENPYNRTRWRISEKGRMYLRYHFKSFFAFWIPTGISFLALLASYDIYVSPTVQKLLESAVWLMRTILEDLGIAL